jgi:hypothetical protein
MLPQTIFKHDQQPSQTTEVDNRVTVDSSHCCPFCRIFPPESRMSPVWSHCLARLVAVSRPFSPRYPPARSHLAPLTGCLAKVFLPRNKKLKKLNLRRWIAFCSITTPTPAPPLGGFAPAGSLATLAPGRLRVLPTRHPNQRRSLNAHEPFYRRGNNPRIHY